MTSEPNSASAHELLDIVKRLKEDHPDIATSLEIFGVADEKYEEALAAMFPVQTIVSTHTVLI